MEAYTTILIQALAAYFDIFTQKAYYMLQQKYAKRADLRPMPVCTFAYVSFLRLQVL